MDKTGKELELSQRGVKRIAHEHTDRITDDAVKRIAYEEEDRVHRIVKAAKHVASAAGRETIKEDDLLVVYNIMDELP